MANTFKKIQTVTVGSGGASEITFSSIPQTYTDLKIVYSARCASAVNVGTVKVYFNGSTANGSAKVLYGETTGVGSFGPTAYIHTGYVPAANATASIFSCNEIYIPNYTSSTFKSVGSDGVTESNNNTYQSSVNALTAGLWSSTAAITSATVNSVDGGNFVQYSTFTLYGVYNEVKATGGIITADSNYFYHTFVSSGTFTPTTGLSCDVLVVAGGGGGGNGGGAGGAGGVLAFASQSVSSATTITVGAGGGANANGNNSQFASLTASVGGGTGGTGGSTAGATGGSGGGGSGNTSGTTTYAGGAGTSGQGNAGGGGLSPSNGGGGGGGAGGAGATGTSGGAGGAGTNSVTNWGALSTVLTITGLGVSGFIAGGGGGYGAGTAGSGGAGAGGGPGAAATANTGSGGGGYSGAGGSGLVIVRYAR
jgi:hypothetical protein